MRTLGSAFVMAAVLMAPAWGSPRDEPKDLLGTWTWTWTDASGVVHKHFLEVEGSGDKIAARERFDEQQPVRVNDLKVADKTVSFSVRRDDRQASYSGKIKNGDMIEGLVTVSNGGQPNEFGWSAKREPVK